jgi:hypothetical protein
MIAALMGTRMERNTTARRMNDKPITTAIRIGSRSPFASEKSTTPAVCPPTRTSVSVPSMEGGITSERRSSTSSAVSCSCGEVVGNAVMTAASPASLTNGGVIPAMPAHVLSSSRDRA